MRQMKCPDCGAQTFFVKDPDDRFTISEFSLEGGAIDYWRRAGRRAPPGSGRFGNLLRPVCLARSVAGDKARELTHSELLEIIMAEQKDPTTGKNLDPFWKCLSCGNTIQTPSPPETCPSCKQKCAFKDVTCYTPDCGGPGNIDPQL